ncbi:uncharacterized protein N7506_003433 [Penicillium brevicompactum]|uniref:uncharacterized protein n=1 Tax=Penicillium brevicompactum TaxID=5074 RepID=UPI0025424123|nr:uncharacterized protein N7506_003433 [Penicillium brevicompactum]KAJ5343609.1 hypothetical protein N7506_003433 [Penicillium brevicompactum]
MANNRANGLPNGLPNGLSNDQPNGHSYHEPGEGPFPIPTLDELTEGRTAGEIIRGQEGIIESLFQVEGLLNLIPQAAPASTSGREVAELEELRRDLQSHLRRLQSLLQQLEAHIESVLEG